MCHKSLSFDQRYSGVNLENLYYLTTTFNNAHITYNNWGLGNLCPK